MATVLLEGIPRHVDKSDLVYAIRDLLHQPEFHSDIGRPPNFDVQLDRDPTDEFDHNGNGTLTIAADDMVVATFISIYGEPDRPRLETESDWDQGELTFSLTSSSPAMDLVQELENSPFVDPHVAQGREARKRALGTTVDLRSVEFGWFCRDNRFSPEWQARVQTIGNLPVNTMPSLRFNADSNEIWISLGAASTDSMTRQAMVVIRFSRIEALLLDMAEPSTPGIIFTFLSPPALEMHENTENTFGEDIFGVNIFNLLGDDKIRRYRLTAFGSTQERITPYTLFAMRVTCTSRVQLEDFRRMARVASLPRLTDSVPSPVVARALFSATTLDRIEGWLQQLPWSVAFQALSILNAAALDPLELWNLRPRIEALVSDADFGVAKAGDALRNLATKLKDPAALIQDEESIFRCFESVKADARRASPGSVRRIRNPGVFNCYHATVTPTRILLDGPFLDQSNRVLRQYPAHQEYFLRVNFTDEDKLQFRWDREVDGASFVKERVGGILEQGLHIAGRHFEFLAYSNSALREHAVWFSATFQEPGGGRITAQSIRDGLGDFYWKNLERQPAKLAARMSQAFSATEPSVNLPVDDDMTVLPDIERSGSVFTDGVGEISRALARRIVKALNKSGRSKRFFIRPSAFQFRMGGFKGVLMVNPDLKDNEIRLRDSQQKFLSPLADIEIAQVFYRAKPFYLNRFLIMILETLGVSAEVFLRLQGEAIREAEAATESFAGCAGFLDTNGCGTSYRISSLFLHMSRLGLTLGGLGPMAVNDGFLNRSIRFAKNHVLREMKHKARIPVKGSYTLVGVADFTGYLPPNTIFACICLRDQKPFCVKGRVLISRSPQVHPGDVQFVEAIGRPPAGSPFEHESYKNCVVFSTQGERAVPSMLAGGDLDGDEYNLILDPSLFPPSCDPPAQYPPATVKTLDRPCATKDLTDWVTDYINSDILGLVCHQFLITADFEEAEMCRHRNCITLAGLASRAVDFAKSGTPVERRELPKGPKLKPDWSVGEFASAGSLNKGTYESQTAIGKLFRDIDLNRVHKDVARQANREHRDEGGEGESEASLEELETVLNNLSRPQYRGLVPHHSISEAIRSSLQQNYIDTASPLNPEAMEIVRRIYPYYTVELRSLCLRHSITKQPLTEEEVIMGTIASRTSQPRQRKAMIQEMRTQADELVKHVQAELKEIGDRTELEPDDEDFATLQRRLQVAWLAWRLSVEQRKTFGAKSFGLIALNVIFDGMRAVDDWRAENETRLHIVGRDASMDTHSSPVNPLRDVPESSKASQQEPIHVILRAQANVEGDAMGRCARESQEAYTSGDRARAKELSNQKKLHKARMDELNKEASEWIFNENNIDRPPYEIDLHGLYVKEALERMGPAIIEARERGDRQLHVIVGRGMHSHDSIGKLRMAIEYFMLEQHIACQPDPRNVGVLIVKLDEDED